MVDLNVEFKLDMIRCHDEGDGPGNAEPYLWTVFFKVDGDTLVVNSDGPVAPFLQGAPTIVTTPGNHGNLGTSSVDEDDDVAIPAIIGEYRTIMRPIPLTVPIFGRSEIGGMIGCIAVLMEEDGTPGSAIAKGHESLDRNVRDRLAAVLGTLSISNPEPSDADIAAMTDQIGEAVKNSISDGVNVLDWLGAFGNMDDQIGSAVFRFTHGQLESSGGAPIPFSRRWRNEGDWELFGSIKATPIRRQEPKCCEETKRRIDELTKKIDELNRKATDNEKTIAKLARRLADLEAQMNGFANAMVREKLKARND